MSAPLRVLIVDDHADLAEALAQVIALHDHQVHVAESAHEGLALARDVNPDVIFLDVGLPDLDGCEAARRLRLAGSSALLVAFTGLSGRADERRFAEAGFDRHVVKPALMEALTPLFDEALARRDAPRPRAPHA